MEYNANSIETLDFRTAVRERIAMYMGSADNQGVLQCVLSCHRKQVKYLFPFLTDCLGLAHL